MRPLSIVVVLAVAVLCGVANLYAPQSARGDYPVDWDLGTREFSGLIPFEVTMEEKVLLTAGRLGGDRGDGSGAVAGSAWPDCSASD